MAAVAQQVSNLILIIVEFSTDSRSGSGSAASQQPHTYDCRVQYWQKKLRREHSNLILFIVEFSNGSRSGGGSAATSSYLLKSSVLAVEAEAGAQQPHPIYCRVQYLQQKRRRKHSNLILFIVEFSTGSRSCGRSTATSSYLLLSSVTAVEAEAGAQQPHPIYCTQFSSGSRSGGGSTTTSSYLL